MNPQRDNVKAGLFVLASIVLAIVIIVTLADFGSFWEKRQRVLVRFALGDGLQGLKEGAIVTLGDQPVGQIEQITNIIEPNEHGPRIVGKQVTMVLPDRYQLYERAVIELVVPTLGSGTKLNIRSVGDGKPYQEGMLIDGGIAPMSVTQNLMRDAGIEAEQRRQIKQIIANMAAVSDTARTDGPLVVEKVNRILDKAEPAVDDTRVMIAAVREKSEAWMGRLDAATTSAKDALDQARKLLADKDAALRDTVDNASEAVANARDLTRTAKEQTMTQVTAAIDKAQTSLENIEDASVEMKGFVASQRPVLERAMANMGLTADQLKLAAVEVRRSPWRLLYRPTEAELDSDNLYDAARSFAMAAGALDSAAKSLDALSAKNPDDPRLAEMRTYLHELFKRFSSVENAFWQELEPDAAATQ